MRPVISATRAGSGGSPAAGLPSAAGLSPGLGSVSLADSPPSCSGPVDGSGRRRGRHQARLPGLRWAGSPQRRPGRRWPPAGRRRGRLVLGGAVGGLAGGRGLVAGPWPAAGSSAGLGAVRVQVSGMPGLPPLVRVTVPAVSSRGQGVAGGGAADPGGVGDDGGGRAAGVGGQRGVDGRCRAVGGGAGTGCRGGGRRGVRRAAGGGAGGRLRGSSCVPFR